MKRPRRRLIYRGLGNRRITLGVQRRLPTGNLARTPLPSRAEKSAIERSNNEHGSNWPSHRFVEIGHWSISNGIDRAPNPQIGT
jgi:hypothetical protein